LPKERLAVNGIFGRKNDEKDHRKRFGDLYVGDIHIDDL
jgi:hypothetical protein